MSFTLFIDDGTEEQTYFYDTEQERDEAIPKNVNPAIILYLLN